MYKKLYILLSFFLCFFCVSCIYSVGNRVVPIPISEQGYKGEMNQTFKQLCQVLLYKNKLEKKFDLVAQGHMGDISYIVFDRYGESKEHYVYDDIYACVKNYLKNGSLKKLRNDLDQQMCVQKIHIMPRKEDYCKVVNKLLEAYKYQSIFREINYFDSFKILNPILYDRWDGTSIIVLYIKGRSFSEIRSRGRQIINFLKIHLGDCSGYDFRATYNIVLGGKNKLLQWADGGTWQKEYMMNDRLGKDLLDAVFDKKSNHALYLSKETIIKNLKVIRARVVKEERMRFFTQLKDWVRLFIAPKKFLAC